MYSVYVLHVVVNEGETLAMYMYMYNMMCGQWVL